MSNRLYHTRTAFLFIFLVYLFSWQKVIAQLPLVKTTVDKKNIVIGEQFQYKIETSMPDNSFKLTWFSLPDSFGNFVVVSKNKIDSGAANGLLMFSQELTLTSFDSGKNVIPPLTLVAEPLDADSSYSLFTDTVPINVSFSPLDSVKTFHDIKNIIEVKKEWPWWIWLLMGVGFLIVIFLIIFLVRVFRKKDKIPDAFKAKLTPFDEAMQSLNDLEKQELLNKNEVKQYHTQLSEIFKRYITRKTKTYKLHLTSDEILMELDESGLRKETLTGFANCLRMNSAVKFAKYVPHRSDSEGCFIQTKEMIKEINSQVNVKTENVV
ncbi:MAG: hypothetical protein ABJA90_03105 [Ginsengibacter sp.]